MRKARDSTSDAIKKVLREHGLPVPEESLVNARWVAAHADWYVQTKKGDWLYYDARRRKWVMQPLGVL